MGASYIALKGHRLMIFLPASKTFPAILDNYDWINRYVSYVAIQIWQHFMVEAMRQQRRTLLLTAPKLLFKNYFQGKPLLFLSETCLIPSIF